MLRQLAVNYQAIGVEMEVVTLDDPGEQFLKELAFPVHALGPSGRNLYSSRLMAWLKSNLYRFDMVVVNGVWLFHGVAVWLTATKQEVPYVVFTHGALDVFFKKRYPLKHLKKLMYWPLQYRVLRGAATVLFTSEAERKAALESFSPNDYATLVLPYGTNRPNGDAAMQKEAFWAVAPQLRDRRFLLFLGRLHEKKGCDLLIEAFGNVAARWPDISLALAGPDQMGLRATLEARAHEMGIGDRVIWPGMLSGNAKYGAFRAAEAFVLPSHQENFGIAVAEALACGTPVLISDQVNIWREIQEDRVGLVEPDTLAGTQDLLVRWFSMPEDERARMAARTERTFEQRFSLRRSAETLDALASVYQSREGQQSEVEAEQVAG